VQQNIIRHFCSCHLKGTLDSGHDTHMKLLKLFLLMCCGAFVLAAQGVTQKPVVAGAKYLPY
jgi:hypothetical protein